MFIKWVYVFKMVEIYWVSEGFMDYFYFRGFGKSILLDVML